MVEKPKPEAEVVEVPEQGILDLLNMEQPAKVTPPPQDEPDQVIFVDDNELSKSGRRELEIMVHCATNIYKVGTKESVKHFINYRVGNDKCKIFDKSIGKISCFFSKILHLTLPKR